MYCGEANYNLGYLIIAEQMLKKSLVYPEIKNQAQRILACVYKEQGHFDLAQEMYANALHDEPDHKLAFELGSLHAQQQ